VEQRVDQAVDLDASVADVWRALTEAQGLEAWFAARAEISPVPGGHIEFFFEDGSMRPAVIEEVEREARLVFRWLPFERLADGSTRARGAGRVELTLRPTEDGTRLHVVESVFSDLFAPA
jgi:uncharacterized protein YndB with AHSA1/START domain